MQRMLLYQGIEFRQMNLPGRYGLAFNTLHRSGESASHLARHERLLFRQYQALRAELADLQSNRPPIAPAPPMLDPVEEPAEEHQGHASAETNLNPPADAPVPLKSTVTDPHNELYDYLPKLGTRRPQPAKPSQPAPPPEPLTVTAVS